MTTEKQLSEKSIEELIVIFFAQTSSVFHFLIQIIECLHSQEDREKVITKIIKDNKFILKWATNEAHTNMYWQFLFNYQPLGWSINELKKYIRTKKWEKLISDLHGLKEVRNNLAHGWFCYENNNFNNEELIFYREKFDIENQTFIPIWSWREKIIKDIIKSYELFTIIWLIATQLRANELLEDIFSVYFDDNLNIIKKPEKFNK